MIYSTYERHLDCPICDNPVVATIEEGEPPEYDPSGGYPGAPPSLVDVDGCACWEALSAFRSLQGEAGEVWYADRVLEKLGEKAVW